MPQPSVPSRWIVVAESPFLPANGGDEREHQGFVQAAVAAGRLAALVVPVDPDPGSVGREDDLPAIAKLVEPAPIIAVPRQRSLRRALNWRLPYVVASRPAPPDLVPRLRDAAPDADGIVVFAYKSHELGRVIAEGLGLPAVIRFHNLEGVYHRALAASATPPRSWAVQLEAARVAADERRVERAAWVTGIADISAADAAVRARRASVPVEYVPSFALGPRGAQQRPEWRPSPTPTVVFLGALDVATNHDAVAWFAREVWPRVRADFPNARWQVVGRRPTAQIEQLVARTAGVELRADVLDPSAFLSTAGVTINPAVSGSGVNIKLLEYLAAGAPVVSTQLGVAALGLTAGEDLEIADRPDDFAQATIELLTDPARAERLGDTGRRSALRILDVDASLQKLARLLGAQAGADVPDAVTAGVSKVATPPWPGVGRSS